MSDDDWQPVGEDELQRHALAILKTACWVSPSADVAAAATTIALCMLAVQFGIPLPLVVAGLTESYARAEAAIGDLRGPAS